MNDSKRNAARGLAVRLVELANMALWAGSGNAEALRRLRNSCTRRTYIGLQLEVGRDELAVLLGDDDDGDEERIDLAAEVAVEKVSCCINCGRSGYLGKTAPYCGPCGTMAHCQNRNSDD